MPVAKSDISKERPPRGAPSNLFAATLFVQRNSASHAKIKTPTEAGAKLGLSLRRGPDRVREPHRSD
jgi:hypothetical protein